MDDNSLHEPNTNQPKMNGLSFSELCCLFCCPPVPNKIVSKLAFLPSSATYEFSTVGESQSNQPKYQLKLNDRADWQYNPRELDNFEVFYTQTRRGNNIACKELFTFFRF